MPKGKHTSKASKSRRGLTAAAIALGAIALAASAVLAAFALGAFPQGDADHSSSRSVPESAKAETSGIHDAARNEHATRQTRSSSSATVPEAAPTPPRNFSNKVVPKLLLERTPEKKEPTAFSLDTVRPALNVDKKKLDAVAAAARAIEDEGYACGAVIVDLGTGQGISYNAHEALYPASSFKAALSCYLLDTGIVADREISNIAASILYSDNDSFEALGVAHMDQDYREWLEAHGITYDDYSPWYPKTSAVGLAACWSDIYRYMHSDDEHAQWFADLLADTNVSFIRDALADEKGVSVWNKAGWITDTEFGNSVSDAGIVEMGGRTYLIAVLSSQPTYDEAHERVKALIRSLFDCFDA